MSCACGEPGVTGASDALGTKPRLSCARRMSARTGVLEGETRSGSVPAAASMQGIVCSGRNVKKVAASAEEPAAWDKSRMCDVCCPAAAAYLAEHRSA